MALPDVSKPTESQLVERVLAGDHAAFYDLLRPYERMVFLSAMSVLNNEADAEEVSQEAILKAFKNLASFRREAKFSTWLVQITFNEARMRLRKYRAGQYDSIDAGVGTDEGEYIPVDFADWREIPSEALGRQELRHTLERALKSLPPIYRQIITLRDIEEMNTAETAEVLGITEASVKTRLSRARLMLRDALAPGYDGNWTAGGEYKKVRAF
jgi:RNA polymerase sigma-70 factor (ECF subfamily)